MSDANHKVENHSCSDHCCSRPAIKDTDMGAMCEKHAEPLEFMVMLSTQDVRCGRPRRRVPYAFLKPHEEWAMRNHSQTFGRLNERGGCSECEIIAIVEHRRWHRMDEVEAERKLAQMVDAWKAEQEAK